MKETGRRATPEERQRAIELYRIASVTPVIVVSSDGIDEASRAAHEAQMFVDSVAVRLGLQPERSWGMRASDGMIMADDSWVDPGVRS